MHDPCCFDYDNETKNGFKFKHVRSDCIFRSFVQTRGNANIIPFVWLTYVQ